MCIVLTNDSLFFFSSFRERSLRSKDETMRLGGLSTPFCDLGMVTQMSEWGFTSVSPIWNGKYLRVKRLPMRRVRLVSQLASASLDKTLLGWHCRKTAC